MFDLLKKNFKVLVKFEIIFSIVVFFAIIPLLKLLFSLSMKITGFKYLTQENLFSFAINPINIIMIIFIGFIIALISIIDYNAINIIYFASKKDKIINITTLIKLTLSNSKFLFKHRSIFLYIYTCLMVPYVGLIYQNPIVKSISVPEFINIYIKQHTSLKIIGGFLSIGSFAFIIITIYVFLFMLNEQKSFIDAVKKSFILLKRTYFELLKKMFYAVLYVFGIIAIIIILISLFSIVIENMRASALTVGLSSAFLMIQYLALAFFDIAIKIVFMFSIADVFYKYNIIRDLDFNIGKTIFIKKKLIISASIIAFVFFAIITTVLAYDYVYVDEVIPDMQIVAHRGSSVRKLENTEPAIVAAIHEGASIIEIDVVETKDHEIILSHDLTVKRLTGIDKSISDMTLSEIKELSMKYKNKEYYFSTLKEIVDILPINVKLMVELKPDSGNEKSLAYETEKILKGTQRHMICSLSSKALKYADEANTYRKKGMILAVAFGKYATDEYIDFISIEETFVDEDVVMKIHGDNRKIYVWQINDESNIDKYLDMKVDGIITDYPMEMHKAVYVSKTEYNSRKLMQIFNYLDR